MAKTQLAIISFLLLILPEVLLAFSASSPSSGAASASWRRFEPEGDAVASGSADFLGKVSRHHGALVAISSASDATAAVAKLIRGDGVGSGSSAQVYSVTMNGCGASSSFAVKVQREPGSTPLENRCDREVEAMDKFKTFPDFVHLLGHEYVGDPEKGNVCMIAMKMADGDLWKWKQTNATSPSKRDLTIQLVSAVKRMHEAGFAHRDIKPSNILLLDAFGHILVGDVSMLCNLNQVARSKLDICGAVLQGDSLYYPPELSMTSTIAKDEEAHDLWSLGITLCWAFSRNGTDILNDSEPHNTIDEAFKAFDAAVLAKETDPSERRSKTLRFARGMRCVEEAKNLDDSEIGDLLNLLLRLDPEDRKGGFRSWVEKKQADIRQYVDSLQLDPKEKDQTECLGKETNWAVQLHQDTVVAV